VCGIAAPILARSGIAHAAIGVQGPSVRLTVDRLRELAPDVTAAADEIASLVIRV
jgi:DNA-binding IclR family transcriptional regulator